MIVAVFDDDVTIVGRIEIHFQHGGEAMRIYQIDANDNHSDDTASDPWNGSKSHQPGTEG